MQCSGKTGAKKFLPMSRAEMSARHWDALDVLLITGDAYVDHPSFGTALIGRVLEADGLRVGIIAQPDWRTVESLKIMGAPRLFCGVTAGNIDSMVANYTAGRHKRREDAYTENREIGKRPNHAATVYAQMCRQAFPGVPVVLGGIEASLRRVAHYDYWEDKLRPSILVDSKADILVYGMGEHQVREIARRLQTPERDLSGIPGTARLLGAKASAAMDFSQWIRLPSWEEVRDNKVLLLKLTKLVEREQTPYCGRPLVQFHHDRAVIMERPAMPLDEVEMDALYDLPFVKEPHFRYQGEIAGFKTIKDSIIVQRGCPGGCTFCGLGFHQGKFLTSRSEKSILKEIRQLSDSPNFRGTISDLGGPTANLYGSEHSYDEACHRCRRPSCLYPDICRHFKIGEEQMLSLYRHARASEGIKHVFIQSGIRMDVALRTPKYMKELVAHHVSGHLKVAPEHVNPEVLRRMRKPAGVFEKFMEVFREESEQADKEQYLVPYFISSFPGCTTREMGDVEKVLQRTHWNLQQVQDFIPLPMTPSAAMYVTGLDYDTETPIPVVRNAGERLAQIKVLRPNFGEKKPARPSNQAAPESDTAPDAF
ncbi:MAG: YgiQ family radical SAM protein [Verrucomicrobiota bacterium]